MTVKSGQVWASLFLTKDATGVLATPSVGPVGALYVDGVLNGAVVTITGSNPYKFSVTLPALTAGQRVQLYVTATISGLATADVVASEQADTTLLSDGVTLKTTQPAITFGQIKIIANKDWDGALVIQNTHADGYGAYLIGGYSAAVLEALSDYGVGLGIWAYGDGSNGLWLQGQSNGASIRGSDATAYGVYIRGTSRGLVASGSTSDVKGFDPDQAKEATLTTIIELLYTIMGGEGWTDETLVKIVELLEAIPNEATVYDGKTLDELIKLIASALLGKLSGGGTGTLAWRDLLDTKDRITTTVDLATGDRLDVTLDGA